MADPHRLTRELRDILATEPYGGLMMRAGRSPDEFASEAVKSALSSSPFVGEVVVDEFLPSSRSVELYRVYDGLSLKMATAMTLGSWWCERAPRTGCPECYVVDGHFAGSFTLTVVPPSGSPSGAFVDARDS